MNRSLEDILFGAPTPRARTLTRVGSVVAAGVLLLLAAGIVFRFHSAGQLDARYWKFFAWPTTWAFLAKGLLGTLASAAMAAVIALSLGLVLLAGRLARTRLVRWPAVAAIEFLRGTPTLLLIYVCFLVLPSIGIKLGTYWMLTLPIALSTAAVVAEVYRSGVLAVPRGQTDAARSLGMEIVLPRGVLILIGESDKPWPVQENKAIRRKDFYMVRTFYFPKSDFPLNVDLLRREQARYRQLVDAEFGIDRLPEMFGRFVAGELVKPMLAFA